MRRDGKGKTRAEGTYLAVGVHTADLDESLTSLEVSMGFGSGEGHGAALGSRDRDGELAEGVEVVQALTVK